MKKKSEPAKEIEQVKPKHSEAILSEALQAVKSKGVEHGDAEALFTMVAELWSVYIRHACIVRGWTEVTADETAQMMVLLKIARSVHGNGKDNYVDAAGYTALAAMLQGKVPNDNR
jgi:hypothetical protein